MAKFAGLRDPVTLDFEHSTWAYCIDAVCISFGALMGTSPVTAFIESATGISGAYFWASLQGLKDPVADYKIAFRGRENGNYRDGHWLSVLYIGLFCSNFRFHSGLGYRRCLDYSRIPDDSQVRFVQSTPLETFVLTRRFIVYGISTGTILEMLFQLSSHSLLFLWLSTLLMESSLALLRICCSMGYHGLSEKYLEEGCYRQTWRPAKNGLFLLAV